MGIGLFGNFAGGMAQAMQQNSALQAQYSYRNAEMAMHAMEYERQIAVMNRQTAMERLKTETDNWNALIGTVGEGLKSRGDELQAQPQTWAVIQDKLYKQSALLAGAMANAYGGDSHDYFTSTLDRLQGQLSSIGTPAAVAMNKSFADRIGAGATQKFGTPTIAGQNAGTQATAQQQTENAQGLPALKGQAESTTDVNAAPGAAAKAGAISGSQFHAIQPGGSLVQPAEPNLAGIPTPAPAGSVAPGASGVIPQTTIPTKLPKIAAPPSTTLPAPSAITPTGSQGAPAVQKQGAATIITPVSPADAEATKANQGKFADQRVDFRNANADADKILQQLETLNKAKQLVRMGLGAETLTQIQRIGNAVGVNVGAQDVADVQAFNKVAFQLAIGMTHQLSARPSQLEFTGALQNTPNPEMDPRAADILINNFAAAAHHLKDQYAAYEAYGEKHKFPSGTPNFEGFDQAWSVPNALSTYSVGGQNYRPSPGSPEAGVRMIPRDANGQIMTGGGNPAYVEEYHRTGPGPTDWQKVYTWGQQ